MRAHIAAIMALTPSAITAYDTDVPTAPTFPYAVFTSPTLAQRSDVMSGAENVDDYFQCTAVGQDTDQARWCQEKMRAALDDATPAVTGYVTEIKFSASGITAVDRDVPEPHPVYSVDTYRYRANPI